MDPAAVESLGHRLQDDYAARIDAIANELNSLVSRSSLQWTGPKGDLFRSWWPAKRSKLIAISQDLHGFGQSALNNAGDQRSASTAGSAPTTRSHAPQRYESRTSFGSRRSIGLFWRSGTEDSFEMTHAIGRTEATYRTRGVISFDAGDAFRVLGFVAAVRGKEGLPFSLGFSADNFVGTEFYWEQTAGESADEIKGVSGISTQMTTWANQITGYDPGEVLKDIGSGKIAQPDGVAFVTGHRVVAGAEIEAGSSVFGGEREVAVERIMEYRHDGTTVDTYQMSGKASGYIGAHFPAANLGSAQVVASPGSETATSLSIVRDATGTPVGAEYTIRTHGEIVGELRANVAGGGATISGSEGVLVERTVSLDLTDSTVRSAYERATGTGDLASLGQLGQERVQIFHTSSDGGSAHAILFETSYEGGSANLVYDTGWK